ncbi:MAG: polynucleotide adenylyltransferase PcnB [Gammaproteobacteria bacterium]|nr:polynucleotide adenylyltransferase PcnB [Gammaproteobacteria bacterium]
MNSEDPKARPRPPRIVPRAEHTVSRADVSSNALKVLYRLKNAGYSAFLVGGGVRDLLLGRHPKDFDVVTDAHPEQVNQLFRNCRLIGRRFRLAHVRFGRDIIEVATFRATGTNGNGNGPGEGEDDRSHSDSGRILRDNVYGSIDEDIWRRDFTVNALYYNIADFTLWDYTNGLEDIKSRTLRLIGDPVTRYREDPVRMLRAVRLAAKLDFHIAPETEAPIRELAELLKDVPPARLFDEVLKLFHAGAALKSFEMLREYHLFHYLFPATSAVLNEPDGAAALEFVREGLKNTDERVREDKPVTPMFLFAVFLWPPIKKLAEELRGEGLSPVMALNEASHRIVAEQQLHITFPKRFAIPMKEILAMQSRFENRRGPRAAKLLEHKRFRAAYDFLLLRARCGEADAEIADWWTKAQELPPEQQREALGGGKKKRRRRSKSRRGRAGAGGAFDAA